jgi:hypothetical protein
MLKLILIFNFFFKQLCLFLIFFKNLNVEINTYKNYCITPHFFLNAEFTVILDNRYTYFQYHGVS